MATASIRARVIRSMIAAVGRLDLDGDQPGLADLLDRPLGVDRDEQRHAVGDDLIDSQSIGPSGITSTPTAPTRSAAPQATSRRLIVALLSAIGVKGVRPLRIAADRDRRAGAALAPHPRASAAGSRTGSREMCPARPSGRPGGDNQAITAPHRDRQGGTLKSRAVP